MSILIPGMSLPKDGEMLVLCVGYNGKVLHPIEFATEDFLFAETGKTAIELPPHGDLIDRSKIVYTQDGCGFRTMEYAHRAQLENITPVIPADPEEGGADR